MDVDLAKLHPNEESGIITAAVAVPSKVSLFFVVLWGPCLSFAWHELY